MALRHADVMNDSQAEYRLCGWRVQPALNRLMKGETETRLEPRVMQVLACLLEAGGEPVTRDALMQRVWGHEYVTEDALNRTVSKLRRFIADDLDCAAEIETIPKTGYRLVQPAEAPAAGDAPTQPAGAPLPHVLRRHWWWLALLAVLLGVVAFFWPRRAHDSPQAVTADSQARVTPLTTLEGKEIDPTLSPDGSHVAFGWRKEPGGTGHRYHIYVRPLSSETLLQVSDGERDEYLPRWSPDGRDIAYISLDDAKSCEVMLVSAVGGPARHLADCDMDEGDVLAWSPDGATLAIKAPGSRGIDFLRLADGTVRHFTQVPASDLQDNSPAFSPDGTLLAFTRWHAAGVANVYVVPVSGGEPKRLTFDNLKVEGLDWEPDSRHLVFSSNRGGPFSLWRVDIDGNPAQRVPQSGRSAEGPVLSRDGRELVYEEWNGQTNLFSIDPAGGAPQQVTYTTRWNWNPAPSPDGKRLAFTSDRSGATEIWVSDKDGGDALKLTAFDGPYTSGPAWSPDGRKLVFDSSAVDGNFDIYEVDADGGTPQRLTNAPAEDRFAHFSPDGKWIYFSSRRSGAWEIWRMPAGGGDAEQVTFKGGYYSEPGPDGALYFSRDWPVGLWRLKPGGQPELVVPDLQPEDCSNWVVGRDRIWYVQRPGRGPVYLASHGFQAGGDGTRLAALPLMSYKSGMGLTPDGRVMIAEVVVDEADLMLITH